MDIEVEIVKDIPTKQIKQFEDRVVYFTAVLTRENTKSQNAYPYLSGDLSRAEIASPISGGKGEYGLLAGVKYAKYVYNFKQPQWTNKSTLPQWYHSIFRSKGKLLVMEAKNRALKELKK